MAGSQKNLRVTEYDLALNSAETSEARQPGHACKHFLIGINFRRSCKYIVVIIAVVPVTCALPIRSDPKRFPSYGSL